MRYYKLVKRSYKLTNESEVKINEEKRQRNSNKRKRTLMLLNEHDKDRVLAFSEGMMLMAKNNKEAS